MLRSELFQQAYIHFNASTHNSNQEAYTLYDCPEALKIHKVLRVPTLIETRCIFHRHMIHIPSQTSEQMEIFFSFAFLLVFPSKSFYHNEEKSVSVGSLKLTSHRELLILEQYLSSQVFFLPFVHFMQSARPHDE